jgi:hypothetical protein
MNRHRPGVKVNWHKIAAILKDGYLPLRVPGSVGPKLSALVGV